MTFADLIPTLEARAALPGSRVKDCKTSLLYLARALSKTSLEECQVDAACREEATWTKALEDHWRTLEIQGRTISANTRRNTRNNLRTLFRLAEEHGLLQAPLPPLLLAKPGRTVFQQQSRATAPYQASYRPQTGPRHYGLPPAQWPPEIQARWRTYRAECGLRLRETTLRTQAQRLAVYLGYLITICGRTPTWDDLFAVATVREFVLWHGARVGRPLATAGYAVVQTIAAMARTLKHSQARALADFRNTLKPPAPLHNKRQHTVSLADLEAVAEAYLAEGRTPFIVHSRHRHPGARRASQFQKGVILKLLGEVPLRQRNVRELQLDKHLYKDPTTGHWHLHFSGDDLKIGTRGGRINEYKVDLSEDAPDFLPVLEEFLTTYRPRLPGAAASAHLFLTQTGKPYTAGALYHELADAVTMRTGTRWHPHMIRTTWATEFLEDTQDYATAATMLGDTIKVVMDTYYHLDQKEHHAKASAWRDSKRRTG